MTTAKFIGEITVNDPDTNQPVKVCLYKESAGGIFGVDSSYIAEELPVISPFENGEVEIEE